MRTIVRLSALIVLVLAFASCRYKDLRPFDFFEFPKTDLASSSARMLLFGDSGTGDPRQAEVAAGMAARNAEAPYDLALMLGDNFYEDGVSGVDDPQFDTKFRSIYPVADFDFPFYVVLGNHDHRGDPQAQYDYVDPDGRWRAPGPAYLLPGTRISM